MKKLLKGVLSLIIAVSVVSPQVNAATNDYTIEVKSKKYSKHSRATSPLYGVTYTEEDATYTDQYWPLVDGYLPYYQSNGYYNIPRHQMVRQFGVSMGVVYWINPAEDYIYWWNTVTGESGKTTPTKSYGVGYQDGIDNPNFAFTFKGAETGSGAISHDWYGNLVHMWNDGMNGWGNTAGTHFVQGYAVYKSATEYGKLMDFTPKLSRMNDTGRENYPFYQRKVTGAEPGTLVGGVNITDNLKVSDIELYFDKFNPDSKTSNPNYPADKVVWSSNYDHHKANTSIAKQPTDFLGVSGNLWGKGVLQGATLDEIGLSAFTSGWSTGQVFHARNDVAYGNMFADGQYTNWYLNYRLTGANPTVSTIAPNGYWTAFKNDAGTTVSGKYTPVSAALQNYGTEYLFRETDVLEYFWSVPQGGLTEFDISDRGGYEWLGYVYGLYTNAVDYYSYCSWTQSRPSDAMSAPEVDSIKGSRVMIHNKWLQFAPGEDTGNEDKRDGSILIRTSKYSGGMSTTSCPVFTGDAAKTYDFVGHGYGYNKTPNIPETFINTGVNCWSELERVNNNVMALYTHVPGQGFSKSFVTAVKPNNAVSNLQISQDWNANGDPVNTLTWTPQTYDKATMHTYEVWYRKKKVGASNYEDKKTISGTSREVWMFAGKASVKYNGAADSTKVVTSGTKTYTIPNATFYNSYEGCTFEHIAPRGDNGDGTKYDRTYEYMIIPVYDASSHRGTESSVVSKNSVAAPSQIYGNLYQVTDKNANEETLYGFSIRLDLNFLPGAKGSTEAKRLIITSAGGEDGAEKLRDAMSVTLADGTPITPQEGVTFVSNSSGGTTTHGAYALSIDITGKVGADGKLPSIIWHNVNPEWEYKMAAHIESSSTYQYTGTGTLSTTLYVPELVWSVPPADFYKLAGDYGSLTKNEDMPIGSFRRIDPNTGLLDVNPTNPVTLNNANYYGTNGGVLRPIYVTEEVLGVKNSATGMYENPGWNVSYVVKLFDENGEEIHYGSFYSQTNTEGYAVCYSNEKSVFFDAIGFKVDYEEKTGEDGRTRKVYNPTQKTYKAQVIVVYNRLNDEGKEDGLKVERSTYTDVILGTTTLPGLDVESTSGSAVLGALYERKGSHFYYNGSNDEGYYPFYYDAAVLFDWEQEDALSRYMGYYGASKAKCYGHYENQEHNPNTWVQYHAGSVLLDSEVDLLNQTNAALIGGGIGYDGTNNWSALAIENNQVPMMIHYVHGGNTSLVTNDASAISNETAVSEVKFDVTLTAEYPIVYRADGKPTQFIAAEDPSTYSLTLESSAMNVMTVPSSFSDMYVTSTSVTTGVEGILTNACGGVKLYPNPVGSTLTVETPMAMGEVKIFSLDGQLVMVVKDINAAKATINVENLPSGVYVVNTLGAAKMMIKL